MRNTKPVSSLWIILMDVLLTGVALVVFAYFHHVRPRELGEAKQNTVSWETDQTPPQSTQSPQSAQTPAATPTPETEASGAPADTPKPEYGIGDFSATFPSGEPEEGEDVVQAYQDENVRVSVTKHQQEELTYFVADVWVRNIRYLQTAFATGKFQRGSANYLMPAAIGANVGAIVAVTGDFCSARTNGVVIRNGQLYRDSVAGEDVCILYADGVMETYYAKDFDLEAAIARGAYQSWSFGPKLLDKGELPEKYNCVDAIAAKNPRSAIGYYEPGHYCFVTVDGRQSGYSKGLNVKDLSSLFKELGCVDAYNLDGGQTAAMVYEGSLVSQPYKGGREVGDIVFIGSSMPS